VTRQLPSLKRPALVRQDRSDQSPALRTGGSQHGNDLFLAFLLLSHRSSRLMSEICARRAPAPDTPSNAAIRERRTAPLASSIVFGETTSTEKLACPWSSAGNGELLLDNSNHIPTLGR